MNANIPELNDIDDKARRRALLLQRLVQVDNTIIDLGYQSEMLQQIAATLKVDKKQELAEIERQTKELIVGKKFLEKKLSDLGPAKAAE